MPYYNAITDLTILDMMGSAAFNAGTGVIGSAALSCVGYGSIAAAAGPLGTIALACGVGGVAILLPYVFIYEQFKHLKPRGWCEYSFTYDFLLLLLNTSAALCAGMLGAAVLGLAVNPIGLCALAGAALLNIFKIIELTFVAVGMLIVGFFNLLNTPFSQIFNALVSTVQAIGAFIWDLFPSFTSQEAPTFTSQESTEPSAPPMDAFSGGFFSSRNIDHRDYTEAFAENATYVYVIPTVVSCNG